ncbi:venom metalloproteinase antarease TserMP_A-like [Dermacentor andersoni]|uniref:venom metalloproteinase antarease TserMP_A-like n=1 Tax=Dermacentor andersoni TaxID=34620 RepID=UPI00215563CB|nr:venom metalloproteinase antarease TserMP_A-like [Dermacentor andersoni]
MPDYQGPVKRMLAIIVLLQFVLWCNAEETDLFVYPSILEERSAEGKLVLRLNDKITLNLEKSSVLADKLLFVTSSEKMNQLEAVDTSAIQKTIYHDTHYQSSVMVREREGTTQVEGIVSHNLRIKPIPTGERSSQGQMLHKIYEVKETDERFANLEPRLQSSYRGDDDYRGSRRGRRNGGGGDEDVFIVELHVVSDRAHQRDFDTNEDLIGYIAVMTNAVNLRYLDMAEPKVRFQLVGLTRRTDPPFAKNVQGTIDTGVTLDGILKYHEDDKIPGEPDLVFLVTGLDLIKVDNGRVEKGIAGRAFIGAVCSKHGVGVGEDKATAYSGVNTMAHELGHLMGSDHDTTPRCPWNEGYLMSYVDGGLKKYRLSPCTEDSIRKVYGRLTKACKSLLTSTNLMENHKEYPGQTVREKYYCRKVVGDKGKGLKVFPMKPADQAKKCKMQCCYWKGNMRTCWGAAILEHMACTKGKTCKRGACGVHEW